MSTTLIVNDINNEKSLLYIENGIITKKEKAKNIDNENKNKEVILPGLVDCQINGYAGVDFNSLNLTVENIEYATKKLWSKGVVSYCPTLITNSHENILKIIEIFNQVENTDVQKSIKGFHVEGPFLSDEDGSRGAHDKKYIIEPQFDLVDEWQQVSNNKIKIITFSPHWDNSLDFIKHCIDKGIYVAIGHTHAKPEQIHEAAEAGSSLSTHFGNGCYLLLPRHNNYLWAQLADDNLWIDFIGDGFHLPIDVIKVVLKAKKGKCFLVSDVTSFGGMKPGAYTTFIGGEVVLTESGKLHLSSNPNLLAGSAQSLLESVNFLFSNKICELEDAWSLASEKPYEFLHKKKGWFNVGDPANYVIAEVEDSKIKVKETYLYNKKIYQ